MKKDTLKRLLSYAKPYRAKVVMTVITALLSVGFTLAVPVLTGRAVDLIIGKGLTDYKGILKNVLLILICTAATVVCQYVMTVFTNSIAYGMIKDLRCEAFKRLQKLPMGTVDSTPHGEILSRIIQDIDQISDGLLMGFTQLFTGAATILGTLGFMLSISVKIALVVVILTPLSMFTASFIARKTFSFFKAQSESRGKLTALIEEMISGQRTVKAFGYEDRAQKRFDVLNNDLKNLSVKAVFFSSLVNPTTRFVNSIVYASVGIFGAFSAIKAVITVGQLTCFLSYANQYTKPFNEISEVVAELQNALACARRVFALIDMPTEIPEPDNAVEMTAPDGNVALKNVSFSYKPEIKLIENLNLSVNSGQRIAIVGPTGCGKTTLINLLMRFYDVTGGEISVSGVNIKNITRKSLRNSYGMVLQETWLFEGSVRDNIAYGKPEATDEEIMAAAKSAHAHSFIKRLPQGYDTILSGEGGSLSQGQKQLLCIARVMLSLPPMLILDEATSSIDTLTERRIQDAFANMMNGRTSFIVAHRLSTIKSADCILVMKAGHIIEQGTHDELMSKNGFYANLYNSQFSQE